MKGSNNLVVGYWEGMELMDIAMMDKSDGKEVIELISKMAQRYSVENRYICYDSDGVGSYIDGFIRGAVPFNGGAAPLPVKDEASGRLIKENYFNLKTQCYYRTGDRVVRGEMKINKTVADNTIKKLSALKDTCPTCLQPIDKEFYDKLLMDNL